MQTLLPLIPTGATSITPTLSVFHESDTWIYHVGTDPIFSHAEDDHDAFKLITCQLIDQRACRQVDICRVFGVPELSVKRAMKEFRVHGSGAFFRQRRGRGPTIMTDEVVRAAQQMLDDGIKRREICRRLSIKLDTLKKAIHAGKLQEGKSSGAGTESAPANPTGIPAPSSKSERSVEDAACAMGTACQRESERVAAAFGEISRASILFEPVSDLKFGGALCALPALEANGLFRFLDEHFSLPAGYYDVMHVVLSLAFMALLRIKCVEQLRFQPPGELGRLLGLDRIPEVKTMREKIAKLCTKENSAKWMLQLAANWMEQTSVLAGVFYVDGHVRLYHGSQTSLPRRYVSRQKLCLRGVTDYWVNDALGQPFFVVSKTVNEGMNAALENDIIPQLILDAPQPTVEQLTADPLLPRFIMIFDRESSGRTLFKRLWDDYRVACISYQKNVTEAWSTDEFIKVSVNMPNGETPTMRLAERGTLLGHGKDSLWVKEIRKLTESGHQISLVATAYKLDGDAVSAHLFSRWTQENFFGYAMTHYGIDRLTDYRVEEFPDTDKQVINPAWRDVDNKIKSLKGKHLRTLANLSAIDLESAIVSEKVSGKISEKMAAAIAKKAEYQEMADLQQKEITGLKERQGNLKKHIKFGELPAEAKYKQLAPSRKTFTNTIKMVAYRSETAMASILCDHLGKPDDARRLACDIMRTEADLLPDPTTGILHVHLHRLANPQADNAARKLLVALNETDTQYPGTDWLLRYRLVGDPTPACEPE